MAEYIDRDKVLDAILQLPPKMDEQGYGWLGRVGIWQMIRDFQSADVAPVKHGKWMYCSIEDMFHCTRCDAAAVRNTFVYCPICGARMDGA